jgi:hypothetical protein
VILIISPLLYMHVPHMLLTFISKMTARCKFTGKILTDASYCGRKFEIIRNFLVICGHCNSIYTCIRTMVICHFWINIVELMTSGCWFQKQRQEGFLALRSNGRTIFGPRAEKLNNLGLSMRPFPFWLPVQCTFSRGPFLICILIANIACKCSSCSTAQASLPRRRTYYPP